jgi:hypothetical protein
MTQRVKEQHRIDRQDSKRRKEVEREEGRTASLPRQLRGKKQPA